MRSGPILLVLAGCAVMGASHAASLKDKPPEGVKLSGYWKLDPYNSDDPVEQLKKAERAENAKRQREIEDRNRDMYEPPWDETSRDRTGNRRRDPFPSRRDDDDIILGRNGVDLSWGKTRSRSVSDEFLLALDPNPATLTIMDWGNRVSVSEDKLETDCFAGAKSPIADAFGDGDRQCGWRGRAWVIETTRVERFKRTDRFELSEDGKVLKYTSTAAGAKIPTIKVARTYKLEPATTSN